MRISLSSSLVCQRPPPNCAAPACAALARAVLPRGAGRRSLRALGLLAALLLAVGCSKQAEGERCDQNNGDFDCDTGLACVGEAEISVTGRGFALCCPTLTPPTVNACRASVDLPPEADAGTTPPAPPPAPDAGNPPAATPDAGSINAAGDAGT